MILGSVRRAMKPTTRLIVVEPVIPEGWNTAPIQQLAHWPTDATIFFP
ncbi:MAG: hypothetical protein DMG54_32440 [Acidobacteria bacterium]|nr:MAG: hypothetical protein DMG54_32440 [Acidobacteriota bacterium]